MSDFDRNSMNTERAKQIVADIVAKKHPYLDVEDVEDVFDSLMTTEDVESAEILTNYAMALHPESTEIMLLRATLYTDFERFDEAEKVLRYVEPIDPDNPDVYVNYGWLNMRKNQMDVAIEYFDRALEVSRRTGDDELPLSYEIAMNMSTFGFFAESMPYFSRYIEKYPNDEQALFEYAYACEKIGRDEESLHMYKRLVELNQFLDSAWYNLGILYAKTGDTENAIKAYEQATTINPENAEPFFNLGNALMSIDSFDEALESYTEYVSLCSPDVFEPIVYQYIGSACEGRGEADTAIRFFKLATEKLPQSSEPWYRLALIYMELDRLDEAMICCDRMIGLEPRVAEYYFVRAQIFYKRQQYEQMARALLDGLRHNPLEVLVWIELLRTYDMCFGRDFNMQEFLDAARAEFGDNPAIGLAEAIMIHKRSGKCTKRALELLGQAMQLMPEMILEALLEPATHDFFESKTVQKFIKQHKESL